MGPYETVDDSHGLSPPSSGVTPLHIAVVNQNINLVQQLVSRGADVATPRVTGLYFRKRIGGLIYYGKIAGIQPLKLQVLTLEQESQRTIDKKNE